MTDVQHLIWAAAVTVITIVLAISFNNAMKTERERVMWACLSSPNIEPASRVACANSIYGSFQE